MRRTTPVIAGLALAATSILTASPALAEGDITTSLPASISAVSEQDIPFTITAPSSVCEVVTSSSSVSVATQPDGSYTLHVNPGRMSAGENAYYVYTTLCDGTWGSTPVNVNVPFTASVNPVAAPWSTDAADRKIAAQITAADGGTVKARIVHNGQTVKDFGTIQGTRQLSWAPGKKNISGTWSVDVSDGTASASLPVAVANKWSLLNGTDAHHYKQCSTVTWSYDPKGEPARASGIKADIQGALSRLQKATGLRFSEVPAATKDAGLRLYWDNLGKGGPSGLGGYSYQSSSDGGEEYHGTVQLNRQDTWVGQRGFTRNSWGLPGRGVLLLHEIAHTAGLGHVNDRTQLMNPITSPTSPTGLASGERAGLGYLYQPASCA